MDDFTKGLLSGIGICVAIFFIALVANGLAGRL